MIDEEGSTELRAELRDAWRQYGILMDPIRPSLYAYCRQLTGDVWDAEDLYQDTLMRGFGRLATLHRDVSNKRAYILRIASHLWIDRLRRVAVEDAALAESDLSKADGAGAQSGVVRDSGARLLQRLAPRERAAVLLKDVFDLSIEETAVVLATTEGAVKAALHRGRGRLREPAGGPASRRAAAPRQLVDRFAELFNAGDKRALLRLVLDNATVEAVGHFQQFGGEAKRGKASWFSGVMGEIPDAPDADFESQRAECVEFLGERLLLVFRTRNGRERFELLVRLEEEDDRVSRLRSYDRGLGSVDEVLQEIGLSSSHTARKE